MDADGRLVAARAVARGTIEAVLALPGVANRGEMLVHNHPSGVLEPSQADLSVAARLHGSHDSSGMVEFSGLGVVIFCLVEAHPGVPEMGMCSHRHAAFHAF